MNPVTVTPKKVILNTGGSRGIDAVAISNVHDRAAALEADVLRMFAQVDAMSTALCATGGCKG